MLAKIEINIGAKPPPVNHSKTAKSNRMAAPCFLLTKRLAHTVTVRPKIIAMIPVAKKFGIIVKADSVPCSQNCWDGPIACIIMPLGVVLP